MKSEEEERGDLADLQAKDHLQGACGVPSNNCFGYRQERENQHVGIWNNREEGKGRKKKSSEIAAARRVTARGQKS